MLFSIFHASFLPFAVHLIVKVCSLRKCRLYASFACLWYISGLDFRLKRKDIHISVFCDALVLRPGRPGPGRPPLMARAHGLRIRVNAAPGASKMKIGKPKLYKKPLDVPILGVLRYLGAVATDVRIVVGTSDHSYADYADGGVCDSVTTGPDYSNRAPTHSMLKISLSRAAASFGRAAANPPPIPAPAAAPLWPPGPLPGQPLGPHGSGLEPIMEQLTAVFCASDCAVLAGVFAEDPATSTFPSIHEIHSAPATARASRASMTMTLNGRFSMERVAVDVGSGAEVVAGLDIICLFDDIQREFNPSRCSIEPRIDEELGSCKVLITGRDATAHFALGPGEVAHAYVEELFDAGPDKLFAARGLAAILPVTPDLCAVRAPRSACFCEQKHAKYPGSGPCANCAAGAGRAGLASAEDCLELLEGLRDPEVRGLLGTSQAPLSPSSLEKIRSSAAAGHSKVDVQASLRPCDFNRAVPYAVLNTLSVDASMSLADWPKHVLPAAAAPPGTLAEVQPVPEGTPATSLPCEALLGGASFIVHPPNNEDDWPARVQLVSVSLEGPVVACITDRYHLGRFLGSVEQAMSVRSKLTRAAKLGAGVAPRLLPGQEPVPSVNRIKITIGGRVDAFLMADGLERHLAVRQAASSVVARRMRAAAAAASTEALTLAQVSVIPEVWMQSIRAAAGTVGAGVLAVNAKDIQVYFAEDPQTSAVQAQEGARRSLFNRTIAARRPPCNGHWEQATSLLRDWQGLSTTKSSYPDLRTTIPAAPPDCPGSDTDFNVIPVHADGAVILRLDVGKARMTQPLLTSAAMVVAEGVGVYVHYLGGPRADAAQVTFAAPAFITTAPHTGGRVCRQELVGMRPPEGLLDPPCVHGVPDCDLHMDERSALSVTQMKCFDGGPSLMVLGVAADKIFAAYGTQMLPQLTRLFPFFDSVSPTKIRSRVANPERLQSTGWGGAAWPGCPLQAPKPKTTSLDTARLSCVMFGAARVKSAHFLMHGPRQDADAPHHRVSRGTLARRAADSIVALGDGELPSHWRPGTTLRRWPHGTNGARVGLTNSPERADGIMFHARNIGVGIDGWNYGISIDGVSLRPVRRVPNVTNGGIRVGKLSVGIDMLMRREPASPDDAIWPWAYVTPLTAVDVVSHSALATSPGSQHIRRALELARQTHKTAAAWPVPAFSHAEQVTEQAEGEAEAQTAEQPAEQYSVVDEVADLLSEADLGSAKPTPHPAGPLSDFRSLQSALQPAPYTVAVFRRRPFYSHPSSATGMTMRISGTIGPQVGPDPATPAPLPSSWIVSTLPRLPPPKIAGWTDMYRAAYGGEAAPYWTETPCISVQLSPGELLSLMGTFVFLANYTGRTFPTEDMVWPSVPRMTCEEKLRANRLNLEHNLILTSEVKQPRLGPAPGAPARVATMKELLLRPPGISSLFSRIELDLVIPSILCDISLNRDVSGQNVAVYVPDDDTTKLPPDIEPTKKAEKLRSCFLKSGGAPPPLRVQLGGASTKLVLYSGTEGLLYSAPKSDPNAPWRVHGSTQLASVSASVEGLICGVSQTPFLKLHSAGITTQTGRSGMTVFSCKVVQPAFMFSVDCFVAFAAFLSCVSGAPASGRGHRLPPMRHAPPYRSHPGPSVKTSLVVSIESPHVLLPTMMVSQRAEEALLASTLDRVLGPSPASNPFGWDRDLRLADEIIAAAHLWVQRGAVFAGDAFSVLDYAPSVDAALVAVGTHKLNFIIQDDGMCLEPVRVASDIVINCNTPPFAVASSAFTTALALYEQQHQQELKSKAIHGDADMQCPAAAFNTPNPTRDVLELAVSSQLDSNCVSLQFLEVDVAAALTATNLSLAVTDFRLSIDRYITSSLVHLVHAITSSVSIMQRTISAAMSDDSGTDTFFRFFHSLQLSHPGSMMAPSEVLNEVVAQLQSLEHREAEIRTHQTLVEASVSPMITPASSGTDINPFETLMFNADSTGTPVVALAAISPQARRATKDASQCELKTIESQIAALKAVIPRLKAQAARVMRHSLEDVGAPSLSTNPLKYRSVNAVVHRMLINLYRTSAFEHTVAVLPLAGAAADSEFAAEPQYNQLMPGTRSAHAEGSSVEPSDDLLSEEPDTGEDSVAPSRSGTRRFVDNDIIRRSRTSKSAKLRGKSHLITSFALRGASFQLEPPLMPPTPGARALVASPPNSRVDAATHYGFSVKYMAASYADGSSAFAVDPLVQNHNVPLVDGRLELLRGLIGLTRIRTSSVSVQPLMVTLTSLLLVDATLAVSPCDITTYGRRQQAISEIHHREELTPAELEARVADMFSDQRSPLSPQRKARGGRGVREQVDEVFISNTALADGVALSAWPEAAREAAQRGVSVFEFAESLRKSASQSAVAIASAKFTLPALRLTYRNHGGYVTSGRALALASAQPLVDTLSLMTTMENLKIPMPRIVIRNVCTPWAQLGGILSRRLVRELVPRLGGRVSAAVMRGVFGVRAEKVVDRQLRQGRVKEDGGDEILIVDILGN